MGRNEKANALRYLFGKIWHYSRGNHRIVVVYWLMFIMSECINTFVGPIVAARLMSVVTLEGITEGSIQTLYLLLGLLLLRTGLSWALHGPARLLEESNAFLVRANYRKYLLRGVMNMPLEWHAEHHSGDTIDKIEKGTMSLHDMAEISFQFIRAFVKLFGCFVMILYFSPIAGFVVLTMMAISAWITMRFDKVISPQYRILSKNENKISESITDSITNISTVVILRVEKLVFEAIMHKVMTPFELFKRNNFLNEWKWFLTSVCCEVMMVAVLGMYFYKNLGAGPGVLVGSVYLLLNYLDRMGELFYDFTSMYGSVIRKKYRVLNAEELSRDFQEESFGNHVLPPDWKELQISGLNFSYHGETTDLHLNNVSLPVRRREKIALVGETGSGKTTLLKVMRDLYHPQSLALSADKVEIPHGFEGISRAISLVPQNPEIFARTIMENITLGAEYDIEFVRRYTDMACFSKVVDSLPRGFESSIKEKGVNLSGGQVQRLALSRGLLACHDKDIVLLDEPTSSLDVATEKRVYGNIFRGFSDKVVISSIHRLHLLPLFDTIYVFSEGKIVGSGTLESLLATCPVFQELWREHHSN